MNSSRARSTRRRGGLKRSLTEDQIVEAALGLTHELGLHRLTMAGLAERLGVGAMTPYSYFRSRDELLDAMARRAELYDGHVDLGGPAGVSNCGSTTTRSGRTSRRTRRWRTCCSTAAKCWPAGNWPRTSPHIGDATPTP